MSYKELFGDQEPVVQEYIQSYIKDITETEDEVYDFLLPFLSGNEDQLKAYVRELFQGSQVAQSVVPQQISQADREQLIQPFAFVAEQEKQSITHTQTAKPSQINQKKLIKAELKLQKKQTEHYVPIVRKSIASQVPQQRGPVTNKNIVIDTFDLSFAGKQILQNASLQLIYGRKYALIGVNGAGKSTLLRAISQRQLFFESNLSILHVEQEVQSSEDSVLTAVLESDSYSKLLLQEESQLTSQLRQDPTNETVSDKLKVVWQKLQDCEADKSESRAAVILSGLGFSEEWQQRPTSSFSGGYRMRIALAQALFVQPDCLFLDEPTNHLDIETVLWLEAYLQQWKSTLLVVSHSVDFLNNVATDVIHIHNQTLDLYKGNYDQFLTTRQEKRKNQQREYDSQMAYRQHLQDFIDRWRYTAARSAQAQSKIKELERLPVLTEPDDDGVDDKLALRWPEFGDKVPDPVMRADDVDFAYREKQILDKVSFSLHSTARIGLVGRNGAGKSTFIKLLLGTLEPTKGVVTRNHRLRVGFFAQHHLDQLENDEQALLMSPVKFLATKYPGQNEEELRSLLGKFGLTGALALQQIRTLSGGQKSRLTIALLAAQRPHVILADEISNHLDVQTINALVKAFDPNTGYQGALILISHDVDFVRKVCKELWVCQDGHVRQWKSKLAISEDCGITEYKNELLAKMKL